MIRNGWRSCSSLCILNLIYIRSSQSWGGIFIWKWKTSAIFPFPVVGQVRVSPFESVRVYGFNSSFRSRLSLGIVQVSILCFDFCIYLFLNYHQNLLQHQKRRSEVDLVCGAYCIYYRKTMQNHLSWMEKVY